jgi:hypothetical protein
MDEATRNRLLRRVDWRFLLGRTSFSRAAGDPGTNLGRAVHEISEAFVALDDSGSDCDLAVLSNPSDAALRTAERVLARGGCLYAEWTRPVLGGPRRIRRRLERAGFADVVSSWPWPSPSRASPMFWIPLEAPHAVRHFLASRPRPGTARARVAQRGLRLVWRVAHRAGLLAPICVTARKAPDRTSPGGALAGLLRDEWASWRLGETPDKIAFLLQTGGLRSINKVVALAFADGEGTPGAAVKLARVPASRAALVREAEALVAAHEGGMPRAGIPRLLFRDDTLHAIGESIVEGQPVSTKLDALSYRQVGREVTDFLAELAGETRPSPRDEWWDRLVEPAVAQFEACFGEIVEPAEVSATRAALSGLPDLPLVCEQRDFSPWNVLVSPSGGLAVVDWESAEPRGLPGLDLVYFLAHAAFFLEGTMGSGREPATYATMLEPSSFTGEVFLECSSRYALRAGIDAAALVPLRLLAWMIHARSDHAHLTLETNSPPDAGALAESVFLKLWRTDLSRIGTEAFRGSAAPMRPPVQT